MLQASPSLLEREFPHVNLLCERNLHPQIFITTIPALSYQKLLKFGFSKSRKYLNLFKSLLTLKCAFLKPPEPDNIDGANQEMARSEAITRTGIYSLTLQFKQITLLPGFTSFYTFWTDDGDTCFALFFQGTQNRQTVRELQYCMLIQPYGYMSCSFLFLILFIG